MEEGGISRGQILRTLDDAQKKIEENPETFINSVQEGMKTLAQALTGQQGGAFKLPTGVGQQFRQSWDKYKPGMEQQLEAFKQTQGTLQGYLQNYDAWTKDIANTVGPVAFIEHYEGGQIPFGPFPPLLPVSITIPKQAVIPMITYFLESLRLIVNSGPLESTFLRRMFTIALAIFDMSNGESTDSLLALMGLFGKTPVLYGFLGRLIHQVWKFVSPEYKERLQEDIPAAAKSIFASFYNRLFETFAPQALINMREKIAEVQARALVAMQQGRRGGGHLSKEELEDLQHILQNPEEVCKDESLHASLKELAQDPIVRLLLEVNDVPLQCGGSKKVKTEKTEKTGRMNISNYTRA